MRFAGGQEPALQRKVIREVEVGGADTAREGAAKGSLQPAGTEGEQRFRIGEEEAGGDFVLADGTAQAGAENILLHRRALLGGGIQEILVCVQNVVAEILVGITVKFPGSRF